MLPTSNWPPGRKRKYAPRSASLTVGPSFPASSGGPSRTCTSWRSGRVVPELRIVGQPGRVEAVGRQVREAVTQLRRAEQLVGDPELVVEGQHAGTVERRAVQDECAGRDVPCHPGWVGVAEVFAPLLP